MFRNMRYLDHLTVLPSEFLSPTLSILFIVVAQKKQLALYYHCSQLFWRMLPPIVFIMSFTCTAAGFIIIIFIDTDAGFALSDPI